MRRNYGDLTRALGIATDTQGSVYVVGETKVGLGENTAPMGNEDLFVAKFKRDGSLLWIKQLGALGEYSKATAISIDPAGYLYVVGRTNAGLSGNPNPSGNQGFLAKYDTQGNLLWLKQDAGIQATAVAIHPGETLYGKNVVVVGKVSTTDSCGLYLYRGDGYHLLQNDCGPNAAIATGVAADSSGNIFISGSTTEPFTGEVQRGSLDYFVAKYGADGTFINAEQDGVASNSTSGLGLTIDSSGNVYVVGETKGALGGNTEIGVEDAFIARHRNDNLVRSWVKLFGVPSHSVTARSVAFDRNGSLLVGGSTTGALTGNQQSGATDYFLAKLSNSATASLSGNILWAKQLGYWNSSSDTEGNAVAIDPNGSAFITGETDSGLGGNSRVGTLDAFVSKYDSEGNLQ